MITIVDYGLGNVQAFVNIYKRLNIQVATATDVNILSNATKIILPGVGAFDWAMSKLNESGMRNCLDDLVIRRDVPVIGICVGMQMMAARSDEGLSAGLGWIDAEVKKFENSDKNKKMQLPHMGWNDVTPTNNSCSLFDKLPESPRFYFLHSYYFKPKNESDVIATSYYHGDFTSAVQSGNVFGVQFHPEKSHQWGIQLLKSFAEL